MNYFGTLQKVKNNRKITKKKICFGYKVYNTNIGDVVTTYIHKIVWENTRSITVDGKLYTSSI